MSALKIKVRYIEILDANFFSSVSDSALLLLLQYTAIQNYSTWFGGMCRFLKTYKNVCYLCNLQFLVFVQ